MQQSLNQGIHMLKWSLSFVRLRIQLALLFNLIWLTGWVLKPTQTLSASELDSSSPTGFVVLAQNCFECHGARKQESGLRLDYRADAIRGGDRGAAIQPGNAADSLLLAVVQGDHPEIDRMPARGEPLAEQTIEVLRQWIDAGAGYPSTALKREEVDRSQHWAFQPVTPPRLPSLQQPGPVGNPIDLFVLERLEKEGLTPAPPAHRVTLARRLALDLTGLPPTPEVVDAFVSDSTPESYERYVNGLLDSVHYGERWARWWLDAARYADSNGFEKDRTRTIWPWRDWVIDALNKDVPFDQFTLEQLAGDLLPNATLDQHIATGFLRNSMVNMEGGIEPEKFRVEAIIDRVDAVSRTWLGLTLACAQCHDHKYDPISQEDYFRFYGLLNQDDEPRLEVPTPDQIRKRTEIEAAARKLEVYTLPDSAESRQQFLSWEKSVGDRVGNWEVIDPDEWHSQPMKFDKLEDHSLLGGGDVWNNSVLRIWVDVPHTGMTGFKIEALTDGNLPFNGPGLEGLGEINLCEVTVDATPLQELSVPSAGSTEFRATTNRIAFRRALADAWSEGGEPEKVIDGNLDADGWQTAFTKGRRNQDRRLVLEAAEPFGFEGGTRLLITLWQKPKDSKLSNHLIGRVRLSLTTQPAPLQVDPLSQPQRFIVAKPPDQRSPEEWRDLYRTLLFQLPEFSDTAKEWDALWESWPRASVTTLAMRQRPMLRETRIFRRGDWTRPGDSVAPGAPAILPELPEGSPANRLGLARWLTDPRNPLTARVVVNRIWQAYFGEGLVSTPEDFGTRAEVASHPELLDWLALEFQNRNWSLKELHRLIVTSSTYQQSSRTSPELLETDPGNRLLARASRFRVDGEMVQDIALQVSGLLSTKVGGPSVFPPLPDGVMQLSYGPIPWKVSVGDDRYRRALYTFWKRSAPHPMLTTFDAPTAEQSCVRRSRSNTPLQALITLNEPTLLNAARWLGWRAANAEFPDHTESIQFLFRQILSRTPDQRETEILVGFYESALDDFQRRSADAAAFAYVDPSNPPPLISATSTLKVAAFSAVARAILNLDENLTRE